LKITGLNPEVAEMLHVGEQQYMGASKNILYENPYTIKGGIKYTGL
jgi:hypothetical protein